MCNLSIDSAEPSLCWIRVISVVILISVILPSSGENLELDSHLCRDETNARLEETERRFRAYVDIICIKCRNRRIDCRCPPASSSPAFELLKDYARNYTCWLEGVSNYEKTAHLKKWTVVEMAHGLGNQLLELVNALQFSLLTGRILILKDSYMHWHQNMKFDSFDSVVQWADTEYFLKHDLNFGRKYVLDYLTPNTIELLMCADWTAELENYETVVIKHAMQDVHIAHANQHAYGKSLQESFLGLDFFFLSHFFWTGRRELDLFVTVQSLPRAMPWDGQRRLGDLIADIREHRPAALLGVHVRMCRLPYHYMDTYHYTPAPPEALHSTGEEVPDDFCFVASLEPMLNCTARLAAERRRAPGGERGVVVLWATDMDRHAAPLLQQIAALESVTVVRLLAEQAERYDRHPQTAMADLVLLSEADQLIATTMSTFSYATHARGLSRPYYMTFRDPRRGDACAAAAGPEAGLLALGAMHDGCTVTDADARTTVTCTHKRAGCLSLLIDPAFEGDRRVGCLQSAARCWDGNASFAAPFLAPVDHAAQAQHYWAKSGRRLVADYPHMRLPACPPAEEQMAHFDARLSEVTP